MNQSTSRKLRSPARKDTMLRRFDALVGRDEITAALELSRDPRSRALLGMMLDPTYNKHSFAKLCQKAGLRLTDLVDVFRRGKQLEATLSALQNLPHLVEETMLDALPAVEVCSRCDGRVEVQDEGEPERKRLCPACKGSGEVRVPGNVEARRMIFQAAGLIGKGRAVTKQMGVSIEPNPGTPE